MGAAPTAYVSCSTTVSISPVTAIMSSFQPRGWALSTWVGKRVRPEIWVKGYFFGVGWVTQISQSAKKCEKGDTFHKNGTRKSTSHRELLFSQLRDDSDMVFFQRYRTHMLIQEKSEYPHTEYCAKDLPLQTFFLFVCLFVSSQCGVGLDFAVWNSLVGH